MKNKNPNLRVIEDKEGLNNWYIFVEKVLRKFNLPIFTAR